MISDIQIAQQTALQPITKIAQQLGIEDKLDVYGNYKAKIDLSVLKKDKSNGKLILVTAINPTKAGEGKTTVSVGLAQALCRVGENAIVTLREPSLGPVFGMKGGAAGGGYSQVLPMEDINLHFTGDMHAITSAHNLIASAIDNHLWQGNNLNIDQEQITWKRVLDMNDRALRDITICDKKYTRESSFQITAASEIMAILCLSESISDLKKRVGNITFGFSKEGLPLTVNMLNITGAVCALLKDAIKPNLVQTIENTPAIIHGGPFANIAHGCNSVIATKTALKLADYVVTEAGFGADLGAEKFLDIKCRISNLKPDVVVLVATIKALKQHGEGYLQNGLPHLKQHIENIKKFNLPVVVAINQFSTDTEDEENLLISFCQELKVEVKLCKVWEEGGQGGIALAETVIKLASETNDFNFLYDVSQPIKNKIEIIAKEIYRANDIVYSELAEQQLSKIGDFKLPICISKSPATFLGNKDINDFTFKIDSIKVASGAGFVIAMAGNIIDMPGLSKNPAMEKIDIDDNGIITGLN